MHSASTKQRMAALRRRLGIFTGWQPRWVKERRKRLARLGLTPAGEAIVAAAAGLDTGGSYDPEQASAAFAPTIDTEHALPGFPRPSCGPAELAASPEQRFAVVAASPQASPDVERAGRAAVVATPASLAATELLASAHTRTELALTSPRERSRRAARRVAIAAALAVLAAGLVALRAVGPQLEASADMGSITAEGAPGSAAVATAAAASAAAAGPDGADGEGVDPAAGAGGAGSSAIAPAAAVSGAPARGLASVALSTVEVRRGDTLWHLAAVHLGDPARWPELHAANAAEIQDPDLIFPGQHLQVPHAARL